MLNKKAMAAGNGVVATDPDFEYVTMLLHGDGTNGAQNNTFIDGSTNNFTVTRNGNTTQGSLNPFGDRWSNYFDGTGDYLSIPDNAAFDFGTGDFTVEAWIYPTGSSTMTVVGCWLTEGSFAWIVQLTSTSLTFALANNGNFSAIFTKSTTTVLNQWVHIAFTRSGTSLRIFLNGQQVGTTETSSQNITANTPLDIGRNTDGNQAYFTGYISNLRIVKGTALYTAAFTPPAAPLTAITNTSLLTCQSNRFIDNSSNNFTITRNGDVSVRPFSPFAPSAAYSTSTNGGSGYFDGTGDYLSVADNANLRLGTSAFTIQAWIYRNAAGATHSIVAKGGASTGFVFQVTSTNVLRFTHGSTNVDTTTTIPASSWTHVAAVRTGTGTNGFQLYINGVSAATATVSTDFNQTETLYVGADRSAANVMNGYISNVKYTNGTAETITVPTAPATATTNVALLLNFTNGGIIDNAADNVLETVGNAQISTSVKKYGTGSLAFDGTGDWLLTPDSVDLRLGTGNFTIEFWLYLSATGAARGVVGKGASTTGWLVSTNASNNVVFTYGSSTITSTGTLSGSTWYHIAVVRSGTGSNQTKIYIGGTNDGTGTVSTDFTQTEAMYVGANRTGGDALNGYIDDLRITKGVARYTANFTPPTSPFPDM